MSNIKGSAASLLFKREEEQGNNATKPAFIATAITATVLLVVLIAGGFYWFLRWRAKRRRNGHEYVNFVDGDASSLRERISKTPLMRQENASHAPEDRESPVPRYGDLQLNPPNLYRSMSDATVRSLPPAYTSIVHAAPDPGSQEINNVGPSSYGSHPRTSSTSESRGLRPLTLVETQHGHNTNSRRSHSNSDPQSGSSEPVGANVSLAAESRRPTGRPRAASRFREEDLDM